MRTTRAKKEEDNEKAQTSRPRCQNRWRLPRHAVLLLSSCVVTMQQSERKRERTRLGEKTAPAVRRTTANRAPHRSVKACEGVSNRFPYAPRGGLKRRQHPPNQAKPSQAFSPLHGTMEGEQLKGKSGGRTDKVTTQRWTIDGQTDRRNHQAKRRRQHSTTKRSAKQAVTNSSKSQQ